MKHTEGTLEYEAATNTIRAKPSNCLVACIDPWNGAVDNVGNAQHLCACWNACAGINPEAVGDLLAACKEVLERLDYNGNFGIAGDPLVKKALMSYIKQAIAKAAD